jgi:ABC-type amino acid transport system permease subunit
VVAFLYLSKTISLSMLLRLLERRRRRGQAGPPAARMA